MTEGIDNYLEFASKDKDYDKNENIIQENNKVDELTKNKSQSINFGEILNYLYMGYNWMKDNDLLKNVLGILMGVSLIFGFISMSTIYNLLQYGLLLYSIRLVIEKHVPENKLSENSFVHLSYLWVSLIGSELVYDILWCVSRYLGGYLMVFVLNYGFTYFLTKTIMSLSEWFEVNKLEKINMKEINFKELNKEKYPAILVNNMHFITKLYSINCVLLDDVFMKYGSKLFAYLFEFINSGSAFIYELARLSYDKLNTIARDYKNKKQD